MAFGLGLGGASAFVWGGASAAAYFSSSSVVECRDRPRSPSEKTASLSLMKG